MIRGVSGLSVDYFTVPDHGDDDCDDVDDDTDDDGGTDRADSNFNDFDVEICRLSVNYFTRPVLVMMMTLISMLNF